MRPTKTLTLGSYIVEKDNRNIVLSSTCKFCRKTWKFYNATRMTEHLAKHCKKIPFDIKEALAPSSSSSQQDIQGEEEDTPQENVPDSSSSGTVASTSTSEVNRSKRPLSVPQFVDRMTDNEKLKLQTLLSKAMIMSNLPFSTFSSPEWIKFFKEVRPSFDLPSDWNLRHALLDYHYEEINKSVANQVEKADSVCILTDGYSNARNEGIMAFIITTPTPLFYDMALPGEEKENSEYVSGELIKLIEKVGPEKVSGICTDNASVMKKAWKIIEEKYEHISCYGCSPHTLNLLTKDIAKLSSIKTVLNKCQKVVKSFKRCHVPLAIFTRKQKRAHGQNAVTLKLPGKTRWSGTEEMLTSLQKNKKELKETVIDSRVKFKDSSIKTIVLDEDFWELVNSTRKLLKPIVSSIIYLEGDERTVADVPTVLARMQKEISEVLEDWPLRDMDVVQEIEDLVESRIIYGLKDVHLAANYLHPIHQGKVLTDGLKLKATKFIKKMATQMKLDVGEVLASAIQFQEHDGIWSDLDIFSPADHLKPASWWRGFCKTQAVTPIAIKLLQNPSSAAPVERLWSNFGLVHNKLRNRLKNTRTKKLVKVRWNLLLSRKDSLNKTSKRRRVAEANESFRINSGYPLLKVPNLSHNNNESETDEESDIDSVHSGNEEEEVTNDEDSLASDTETELYSNSESDN